MLSLRSLSFCMFGVSAPRAGPIYQDFNFRSGWTDSTVTNQNMTSQSYTTSNPSTGGDGTFYRQETHVMNQAVSGVFANGRWLSLNSAANYNPGIQGALASLDFSYDLLGITIVGQGVVYGLAIVRTDLPTFRT